MDVERRENILVKCFLHGMLDKNSAEAVKLTDPIDLNDAFKKAKHQAKHNYEVHDIVNEIRNDTHEIKNLQQRVLYLEKLVKDLSKRISMSTHCDNFKNFKTDRVQTNKFCYNCKKEGHFSKDCRLQRRCYNCNNFGHISINCPNKRFQSNYVKDITDNTNSEIRNRIDEDNEISKSEGNNFDEAFENTLSEFCAEIKSNEQPKKTYKQTLLDKHVNFINGQADKPRTPLTFKNKPVLKLKVGGNNTTVLIGHWCDLQCNSKTFP